MSQKTELGKGLKALLGNINKTEAVKDGQAADALAGVVSSHSMIPLVQIKANPHQPRTSFDEEQLNELATSIKTYGLIQPVTLRKIAPNEYELISGERRFRAAKIAGLSELPAYIRQANDTEILEMGLVENIQREDLNPIEIAISYQRLIEECKFTHEYLSDRVGKKRSTVSNYTRLLKLPPEIQTAVREKAISMGHARVLAGVDDLLQQMHIYKEIKAKDLSVRDAEKMAQSFHKPTGRTMITPTKAAPSELKVIEQNLSAKLGTKIKVNRNAKGEGQIVISFKSDRELNDILDILLED